MGHRLAPVGELARDRARATGQGLLRTALRGGRPPLSPEERRRRARERKRRWLASRAAAQRGARPGNSSAVKGGIIIPDTAKEKPQEGKVVAVGNGKVTDEGKKIPLDVKAGDKILFGKYSGSEVKIDDKEYLIMREDDVLAILE